MTIEITSRVYKFGEDGFEISVRDSNTGLRVWFDHVRRIKRDSLGWLWFFGEEGRQLGVLNTVRGYSDIKVSVR